MLIELDGTGCVRLGWVVCSWRWIGWFVIRGRWRGGLSQDSGGGGGGGRRE